MHLIFQVETMASLSHLLMIAQVTISFFLLLHSPNSPTNSIILSAHAGPSSLVDRVCKRTKNTYADCMAALALDPRTPSAPNLKALAKIALGLAEANTTKSKAYIDKMAKSKSTSPSLKTVLDYCVSQYKGSVLSFHSAVLEVDEDVMTANYDAKVASDGADYCENQLSSKGFQVPSVTTRNNYVMLYSDIGCVITSML